MRRYLLPGIVGIAGVLLLTLVLAMPAAAAQRGMWDRWSGLSDAASIERMHDGMPFHDDMMNGGMMSSNHDGHQHTMDPSQCQQ